MKRSAWFLLLIPLLSCYVDKQIKVVDPQLGYSAVFPARVLVYPGTAKEIEENAGEWRPARNTQPSPFGEIEWFSRTRLAPGKMNRYFTVEVGNLPPGEQGGSKLDEILATLKQWNTSRFPGPIVELGGDRGPGFEYYHKNSNGDVTNGIIVFRRGRIHHARGSSDKPKDPLLINFLNSFQVDP